jgi:hypothetical protein
MSAHKTGRHASGGERHMWPEGLSWGEGGSDADEDAKWF